MKPAVFVTTVVKDEADIIGPWVDHYAQLGADQILILNGSSDTTNEILEQKKVEYPGLIRIWRDHDPAHRQDLKMTGLCEIAHARGAEWILPVDGDEFWRPMAQTLEEFVVGGDSSVRQVRQIFHYPSSRDNLDETNPVLRIRYHGPTTLQNAKVCFRWQSRSIIEMGNHSIILPQTGRTFGKLTMEMVIHHFPYRSEDQFVAKIRKGIGGLAAASELNDQICSHWRAYGRILSESGEDGLRSWYRNEIFHDESRIRQLSIDPEPFYAIESGKGSPTFLCVDPSTPQS